jgi:hypothetical protein
MKGRIENIDDLFASELKDFSPNPPAGIWENIEKGLAKKQNKKAVIMYYRIAAGIALLLATGSLGLYLFNSTPGQQTISKTGLGIDESKLNNAQVVVENKSAETDKNSGKENSVKGKYTPEYIQVIKSESENISEDRATNWIESEESISSITAEIPTTNTSEPCLIYEQQQASYSNEYIEFLSKFDEINQNSSAYSKWSVGGQAGPQYSYRELSSIQNSQDNLEQFNESESALMAYAGGLNIAYKPARRLSIQSGIYYSKIGQTTSYQPSQTNFSQGEYTASRVGIWSNNNVMSDVVVSTSMGEIKAPASSNTEEQEYAYINSSTAFNDIIYIDQYLEFLELPLLARYAIIDRKIDLHLMGGFSTNFLIGSPVLLEDGSHYTNTSEIKKVNYSSTFGFGLGYNFSSNFVLSIEPQFKYYLNKVNTNSDADVHPYSFGVFTGITYLF